jgi:hypothetical protein
MSKEKELIEGVKDYALKNYEKNGWDIIVECFSDADIASEIIGSQTISEAILAVADIAEILNDQRLEAGGGW